MEKGLENSFSKMLAPNAVSFKYSCQKSIQLNYLLNACYCARPYAEHCRPEITQDATAHQGAYFTIKTRCIYQKTSENCEESM